MEYIAWIIIATLIYVLGIASGKASLIQTIKRHEHDLVFDAFKVSFTDMADDFKIMSEKYANHK